MGKIMNRVKGIAIVAVSAVGGALGLELGGMAGNALYSDLLYVTGQAPSKIYCEGTVFKRYTAVNPYNGHKTRVAFDKKAGEFKVTKHQPKGFDAKAYKPFKG